MDENIFVGFAKRLFFKNKPSKKRGFIGNLKPRPTYGLALA
jgi:hypothetical protein